MVRALAYHRCGPDSIPGPSVTCGLSLLLVLVLALRVFLRVLGFSYLHKNQHSKFRSRNESRRLVSFAVSVTLVNLID